MHSTPVEEKYPLLLLYVDENGKRSEFPRRVVFADKGRGKNLATGTANILSKWPAQVTSCWLTALTFAFSFVLLLILMLITSLKYAESPYHLRCARHAKNNPNNQTIHLVKDGNDWTSTQLEILQFIVKTFPDYNIHTTVVEEPITHKQRRELPTEKTTVKPHTTELPWIRSNSTYFDSPFLRRLRELFNVNELAFGKDSDFQISDYLLLGKVFNSTAKKRVKRERNAIHKMKILNEHPNINEKKTTFHNFFTNTALQYFWMDIPHEMLIFAMRAQELWQHGGISFYLPTVNSTFLHSTKNRTSDNLFKVRLKNIIIATRERYHVLNKDLVSIDGEGFHMAAKIPCHSFFGEILIKLQHDIGTLSVPDFIHKLLNVFCESGAVDSEYCNKQT